LPRKADKHGFGTAHDLRSKVWFTLRAAELSDVYYPGLGSPAIRDLEFAVTDGRTFLDRETRNAVARVERPDPRSLTFRQVVESRRRRPRRALRRAAPRQRAPGGADRAGRHEPQEDDPGPRLRPHARRGAADRPASLGAGFAPAAAGYAAGWEAYLASLAGAPRSVAGDDALRAQYDTRSSCGSRAPSTPAARWSPRSRRYTGRCG